MAVNGLDPFPLRVSTAVGTLSYNQCLAASGKFAHTVSAKFKRTPSHLFHTR